MASTTIAQRMNSILAPYMFQVIGSTPGSIRDSLKKSALKNNPDSALPFACACIFAASVNKPTMENFIAKPEMIDARPVISSAFSISGKPNMTGMTLLGHCFYLTDFAKGLDFCAAFIKKMGQENLWDGNLESGSLSDKQKEILKEKKKVTDRSEAALLAFGFFKFSGLDSSPMSVDEATFWGEPAPAATATSKPSQSYVPRPAASSSYSVPRPLSFTPAATSPPRSSSAAKRVDVTLADGTVVAVREDLVDYYLAVRNGDVDKLAESIANRGVADFEAAYSEAMNKDPQRRGGHGGTVIS